jgi:hypothetical protein
MDFKKATDHLFERVSHDDLAQALGVSVAAIRQARLREDAGAFRSPPPNWETAIVDVAQKQITKLNELLQALKATSSGGIPNKRDKSKPKPARLTH